MNDSQHLQDEKSILPELYVMDCHVLQEGMTFRKSSGNNSVKIQKCFSSSLERNFHPANVGNHSHFFWECHHHFGENLKNRDKATLYLGLSIPIHSLNYAC